MLFLICPENIETFLLIFFPYIKYQNFTVHIPSVLDYFSFSLADVGLRIFLARTFEVEFRPGVFFISYTGTTIFTIPPFYQRRRTVSLYRRQGKTPRLILDLGTTCRVLALSIYLSPPLHIHRQSSACWRTFHNCTPVENGIYATLPGL